MQNLYQNPQNIAQSADGTGSEFGYFLMSVYFVTERFAYLNLIKFINITVGLALGLGGTGLMSDEEAQEHFDNFFEDVFIELEDKYGEIEEMNVCDNLGDHLVGNVYVKVCF